MDNVRSGETVRLEQNVTLERDLTVPDGVTLILPCIDNDPGYVHRTHDGQNIWFNQDANDPKYLEDHVGVGKHAYCYRTLTVPAGVTLTVNGTVMVNAVTGRPSGGHNDMDVTGGYAQIELAGDIVVSSGGVLESFGYIKGGGQVTVKNGGSVGDLFIVRNWRGGTLGEKMYNANVYPMNESDCRNIESDVRVEYGGSLTGLVKMSAALSTTANYYYTRFPQVDVNNGLIRLTDRSGYVLRSYDSEKEREIYVIYGGAEFSYTSLTILGMDLSTGSYIYPIDGDMDYVLADGQYTFTNDYKVLTGATMTVKGDASLTVAAQDANNDGTAAQVVFYDVFEDLPNTDNTQYPWGLPAATLTLEEGAAFTNAGTFAGTIVTDGGNVFGTDSAVWTMETKEANGYALTKPYIVRLNFALIMECDDYTWRFGSAEYGESAGSIIWYRRPGIGVHAAIKEITGSSVSVLTEVYNTTDAAENCSVYVAAYDATGRMLTVFVEDGYAVGAQEILWDTFRVESEEPISMVEVFLLDQSFTPLGASVTLNVK